MADVATAPVPESAKEKLTAVRPEGRQELPTTALAAPIFDSHLPNTTQVIEMRSGQSSPELSSPPKELTDAEMPDSEPQTEETHGHEVKVLQTANATAEMTSLSGADDPKPSSPQAEAASKPSMSEAPQSSNKVSREREEDTEDEPAAKRAKMDLTDVEIQTKAGKIDDTADDAAAVTNGGTASDTEMTNGGMADDANGDTVHTESGDAENTVDNAVNATENGDGDTVDIVNGEAMQIDSDKVDETFEKANGDATKTRNDDTGDSANGDRGEVANGDSSDHIGNNLASTAHLYDENGQRKSLCDPSLDPHPITEWQNRQIRNVIAGVKKTKAGAHFKAPVAQLWPLLWNDYSAKVTNPTDFSTMEKRLRGDGEEYKSMGDFKADLELLVQNAVKFNGPNHFITQSARAACDSVLQRMLPLYAAEPPKPEKKSTMKQHPTRHVEPRTAPTAPTTTAPATSTTAPAVPSTSADTTHVPAHVPAVKSVTSDIVPKPAENSPAFAIPPGNNGMPLIRRDSKAGSGNKRAVKPTAPRDFPYMAKRKQKLPPDMRFCQDVLQEIKKARYGDLNQFFLLPVDTVALNIPKYYNIVKKPMDLDTMEKKMSGAEYNSVRDFEKDFDQIVKNSKLFNGETHDVTVAAVKLQDIFKAELAKKEEWMSKHAPASATSPHGLSNPFPLPRDDVESEDAESELEIYEQSHDVKTAQDRFHAIQRHIAEEQKKVDEILASADPDTTSLEIVQSMVQMLQKKLVEERKKMGTVVPLKKAGKPKTSAKPKKASGSRKLASASSIASGGAKKTGSARKPTRKKLGVLEKDIVAAGIGELEGKDLERAIDIIKKDTGTGENDSGELELDIESLSESAMWMLYDIATQAFPNLRAEKEAHYATTTTAPFLESPVQKTKGSALKGKKNKPMTKAEQERRIQQLKELRAQVARQGSGSQEPIESIEGNGGTTNSPLADHEQEHDSDEDESSEEE